MLNKIKKITAIFVLSLISFLIINIIFMFLFYLYGINLIVKSDFFANKLQNIVKTNLDMDLIIQNPDLKTSLKSEIDFKIDNLSLKKNNETLVELQDFDTSINFKNILNKQLKLNKLNAKTLIIKADKLFDAMPNNSSNSNTDFFWKVDFFNADIKLDFLELSYYQKNKSLLDLYMRDIFIQYDNEYKNLGFNMLTTISKNNKTYAEIVASTLDEIRLYDDHLKINNLNVLVNNSKLKLNSKIDLKHSKLNAISEIFYLEDIFKLINSDFILPDGSEMLKPLKNPKGNVDFNITLKDWDWLSMDISTGDLSGYININHTKAELKDLTNIPLIIQKGKILINKNKITFKDLTGFYGKNKNNNIKIQGTIKDYYKTFDSDIIIDTLITNEFFKSYLSPLINNTVLKIDEPTKTRIIYKAKNNIMDIIWLAKIPKGIHFGIDDVKSDIIKYDRAFKGEFHIEGDKLDAKNINYYIAPDIKRGVKLTPIFILSAKMNLNGKISQAGFSFGREMPSEILNAFLRQEIFKKGTIKGNIDVKFKNNIPYLIADMELKNTFIPSQRLYIKDGALKTNDEYIIIDAQGGFKRAKYKLSGLIKNRLEAPYIVKNLKLDIDKIDIQRFLASVNNQENNNQTKENCNGATDEIIDDNYMFDTNLIRIENSNFTVKEGNYKELTFGNVEAKMILDEKGILKLQSNRFDIAQGRSSLKVECDLKNLKYYIRLGIKEVDSNLMAKVLLNLDKEISGKASGLIELNSDKTLKLNGDIKFMVENGTIGKIGLVEYVLKIASLFRNPLVMINPAIIADIVSVPEGKFDKITGTLLIKDNVVRNINIKSYSKTLSALIRGRFDLERHDASLRIYTRFSNNKNSIFGFLRKVSLNTLANKVKMNSRNDANYYEAELKELPQIEAKENQTQVFLTQVEGDLENNNFISSLKKIK